MALYYVSEYYSVIQYSWGQGRQRMGYRKGRDSEGWGGNITRSTEPQQPILMTIKHAPGVQASEVVCSHADTFLQFHSDHIFYQLQNSQSRHWHCPCFPKRTVRTEILKFVHTYKHCLQTVFAYSLPTMQTVGWSATLKHHVVWLEFELATYFCQMKDDNEEIVYVGRLGTF